MGRNKKYAYYRCWNKGCSLRHKDIKREELHEGFEKLLAKIRPSEDVLNLTQAVIKDIWRKETGQREKTLEGLEKELTQKDLVIKELMQRLVQCPREVLKNAYEEQIEKLHKERTVLKEILEPV